MNKLISSALMTVVAVPFLMAAPAAKKAQNAMTPAATTKTATKKTHKVKKTKAAVAPAAKTTTPAK